MTDVDTATTRSTAIVDRLKAGGVGLAAYLPDSWLSPLIGEVVADPSILDVRVTREDDAVAIAGGAALMGLRSAVLCQNAGVLLSANVLAAFAHHHELPLVVVAAARGGAEDGFYYQMYKGQVTAGVAAAAGLTVHHVDGPADDWLFEKASEQAWLLRRPVVLLCSRRALLGEPA
ncbi:thiamine pyrophosphate-binding protein [Nocardioides sp. LHD-245]|uniref:thiamine pyrophosphate-binding protein n=1 Tax=Nocardioides sp. LHD-245 TaxID=3051387 RepID=UPI0027DED734|nr:thiamine pyrophosphate-binding protein [Nocardioides sp. LHD-245]